MSRSYDGTDETKRKPPSLAVVEAVADAEGIKYDQLTMPAYDPLHSVVDPTALDELFAPLRDGRPRTGSVSFSYCGYDVTVDHRGTVSLE
ncbi:HalOD1 output domain-containing protein [Natronococcus sp. A-GB7]|uniref:HalOD1 output domain-containing protein n=1 Tax=Natronococcus sp. A-GB7 TaxID=3037649 RepID=UPI00241C4FC1|nr:HalOD1 output domain-containing protein [Natronococcus sp. A-GB7]MDG5817299.1 hypothetical protein [Natronococcus sp. A-GB7]